MRIATAYFFLLSLFIQLPLLAQLHGKFRSITVDDGLAQNSVWDILQDSTGYYWFATADGISRFDGIQYKHYKRIADQNITISGNTVGKLFLDSKDRVWAMHNYGVSVYNRLTDQFDYHIKNAYPLGEVDGAFWVLINNSIVSKLDLTNLKEIRSFPINRPTKKTHYVTSRHVRIGSSFYLAGKGGVERIDVKNEEHELLDTPLDFGGSLIALNDSIIFCPHLGSNSYLLNVRSRQFELNTFGADFPQDVYVTDMQLYKNYLLLGSHIGVFVLNRETLQQVQFIESFETGPGYRYVESIYLDADQNLFFGTNGNGVKVFSPYENRFPTYSTHQARLDFVKAITVLENGQLVTGVYEQGLIIYDDLEHYRQVLLNDNSLSNSVPAVHALDEDRVFLMNYGCLVVFNTKTDMEEFRVRIDTTSFSYPVFYDLPDGWLLNTEHEILQIHEDYMRSYEVLYRSENSNLYISCFAPIDSFLVIGNSDHLILYERNRNTSKILLEGYMKSILVAQQRIFVAAQSGLFEMSMSGELLLKHDVSTGLTNDFIYGVLEDDFGYLWVSHNKGISRIKPGTYEYLQFDVTDGLQSNEFNTGAYYKHTDGKLYFGGVNGVNVIDPANLILNKTPPKVVINQISLFDQPLAIDSAINELDHLEFDDADNTLSFEFSSPDFSQPGSIIYAYKMDGLDDNWIESGSRNFARYASLPPGDYTFQVKAANGDGVWMSSPKTIQIRINPPYWQTWWFLFSMGILALLLFSAIMWAILTRQRIKLRRELEIQQQLEIERIRISRDLHDNVGAQLSYLITNMEWIADHPDSMTLAEHQVQLKQLSETGRQAITTLRQTIWAISQNAISLEEFADRFKQYAMKMAEMRPEANLRFQEQIESKAEIAPAIALNLFRICQEALNNALKHAQASEYLVTFATSEHMKFFFELKDNGRGFDMKSKNLSGHYGLINMRARAKESDSILEISSSPSVGTTVKLTWQG